MLNQKDLLFFKNRFEQEKQKLIQTISNLNQDIGSASGSDELDLTALALEQNLLIRLKGREAQYLKKVNEALSRIQDGSFGICMDCDQEISTKRLRARPTASLCISCKEEREKQEQFFVHSARRKLRLA